MESDNLSNEIGKPGRYNNYGEWKPLFYNGDHGLLQIAISNHLKRHEGTFDYLNLYGIFQYIMATKYHIIEFILKTNVQFPYDFNKFNAGPNEFHLSLVKFEQHASNNFFNMNVYDCSVTLKDITIDNVKFAMESISAIFSRIAFQVDSWYEIIYKYSGLINTSGKISLHTDTTNLINYFSCFHDNDYPSFDLAIEWYVGGNNSDNLFHKFLSYCIALETIAIPFIDGNLIVSGDFSVSKLNSSRQEKINCIEDVKKSTDNLIAFIDKAYTECISMRMANKIENAIKKVFGSDSSELAGFNERVKHYNGKDYSLYNIRSKLAHGEFSIYSSHDVDLVQKRIRIISSLTKKFIMTLLNRKRGKNKNIDIKKEEGCWCMGILMTDPRSTGITNNLNMIANSDWKIKTDWLF